MSHIQADRIKETATTTGTGSFSLGGAVSGFLAFSARMANNDTTYYCIEHQSADEWEVGFGTWQTGPTLARTTVLQSSNGDAAVNFSAGTKHVFITIPSIAAGFGTLTVTPSSDQNDYAPSGLALASRVILNVGASMKLTGLGGGHETRRLTLVNGATDFLLWLENENTASSAENRFALPDDFPLFLLPGDWVELIYRGSRWEYATGNQPGTMGLAQFDDFMSAVNPATNGALGGALGVTFSGASSGVGVNTNNVTTTHDPCGQISLDPGTTTTGRASIGGSSNATIIPSSGMGLVVSRIRINVAVDGTNTFSTSIGFIDGNDGTPNNGVCWEYRWTGSAAEWSQTRWAAATPTRSNTGSPAASTTFVWMVVFVNPAWSRVDFIYSTDSVSFTKADSPTTGIPTSTQTTSIGINHIKSAGTTSRFVILDLFGYRMQAVRS